MLSYVLLGLLAAGGLASSALLAWSSRHAAVPLEDGARLRTIAEVEQAGDGLFRIRGRIVARETTPSEVDGARCVYVLRASVDPGQGVLRDVAHELRSYPFHVEDGTGTLEIDPAKVVVDAPAAHGEAGLVVEQRLVAGEEVEVVARFRAAARGSSPYRGTGAIVEPIPDEAAPPRVSPRRELLDPSIAPGPTVALARGAAAALMGASVLLSWLLG